MAVAAQQPRRPSRLAEFWSYFSENRGAVFGLAVFALFVFVAIFAGLLAPYSPTAQMRDFILVPPAWQEGGTWAFPLGTDPVGRDMLSRLLYGARYSFFVGIVVVVVWAFVNIWGSFLIPFILLRSSDNMPASVAIYSFYSEAGTPIVTLLAAYALIYSLPVVALYLFVSWKFGFRFFGGIKA